MRQSGRDRPVQVGDPEARLKVFTFRSPRVKTSLEENRVMCCVRQSSILIKQLNNNRVLLVKRDGSVMKYHLESLPERKQMCPFSCSVELKKTQVVGPLFRDSTLDMGLPVLSFPAEVLCGKVLLVGAQWKGHVSCIDTETGQEVFSVRPSGHSVTVIRADPDSNQVAIGDSSGQVTLFRVNPPGTKRPLLEMRFRLNSNTGIISDININTKMKVFSVASSDCSVVVYNYITCQAVASLAGAKLIERTAQGEYVRDADGNWHRKK